MTERGRPRDERFTITSAGNERIRFVRSLYKTNVRRQERLFVVEGVRLLEEALAAGARPEIVLVAPDQLDRTPRGAALLDRLAEFTRWQVTEAVLKALSETVTPQGVVAVFPVPEPPARADVGPVVLVLDRLRDPGNAGAILRSADASGVVRTVAFVDSVDAFSPKVVRAAMGAHFRLAILEDAHFPDLLPRLGRRPIYLAAETGGVAYDRVRWAEDCVLIVGGEADGAEPEAIGAATRRVTIPMAGPAESLNAAMAGTILLFEAARARRAATGRPESAEIGVEPAEEEPAAPPPRARPPRETRRAPAAPERWRDDADRPRRDERPWPPREAPRDRGGPVDRRPGAPFPRTGGRRGEDETGAPAPRRPFPPPHRPGGRGREDDVGPAPPWRRAPPTPRPGGRRREDETEAPPRPRPPGLPPPRDRRPGGGDAGPPSRRPSSFDRPGRPPGRERGPEGDRPRRPPFRPKDGPPSDRPRRRPKE